MNIEFPKNHVAIAVASVLSAAALSVAYAGEAPAPSFAAQGTYATGDFHNHTTCSDGSISMQKLVKKSMDTTETPWGLDWFVQAGHGGSGNRNCTLAEDATLATPAYPLVLSTSGAIQGPATSWQNTNPSITPKGRAQGNPPNRVMWRWQSVQEFQYPITEYLAALRNQPVFMGVESVVAGHEHTSMSVVSGQLPADVFKQTLPTTAGYTPLGNATALAEWTYCFDRGDTDTSRGNTTIDSGVGNNWNCGVAGSANEADPNWNAVAAKLMPAGGAGTGERGHFKTVEAMKWMGQKHPYASYYVPAHLERAGPFNPNGNNGFNVEHLRNLNNAAPTVAFGMETQPGHGASDARGEYTIRRNNFGTGVGNVDSAGGTTWGGTGIYGAQIGGVWDALLGEGRNWWFFASSDWHNRGSFGPDDRRSTQDFYPGEYQRDYVLVGENKDQKVHTPDAIVNGLRSGNSWTDSGQLVDRLTFVVCADAVAHNGRGYEVLEAAVLKAARNNENVDPAIGKHCAKMGQKLKVRPGAGAVVAIAVRDPSGTNYSPYNFANPSLAQVGIEQPLNKPVLDHFDLISGKVTGYKTPGAADYSGEWPRDWIWNTNLDNVPAGAKNTTAGILRTFNSSTWKTVSGDTEYKVVIFRINDLRNSMYLRLRGTNLPASVPFETDADGSPLADLWTNQTAVNPSVSGGTDGMPANANLRIPCNPVGTNIPANGVLFTGTGIDGCPAHLPAIDGQKYSAFDVAAWADLWFYSNPVFIEVQGSSQVAGVK